VLDLVDELEVVGTPEAGSSRKSIGDAGPGAAAATLSRSLTSLSIVIRQEYSTFALLQPRAGDRTVKAGLTFYPLVILPLGNGCERPLSRAFAALADPTRRAILERLAAGEAGVVELAESPR